MTQSTLVIVGTEEDMCTPAANSLQITEQIPGAWLVQMKGEVLFLAIPLIQYLTLTLLAS